jgi:RimJ/RimL family protein N-acetyltransferase
MKLNVFVVSGLLLLFAGLLVAILARKVLPKLQALGLRTTLLIINVKIKLTIELLLPRTIWGERVGLRTVKSQLSDADVELLYRWSRDEEILRWSGGKALDLSLDEFRHQMQHERWRIATDQIIYYIITTSNELIGRVGLYSLDWEKREGEFGISIDQRFWNQHFGRETVKLFINHIFSATPINRIYLGTFKDNVRAQRAFTACGFRVIGAADRYNPILGEYGEGIKMEILRKDFYKNSSNNR